MMTKGRTVLEFQLRPVTGTRFQPTGFPDLGAATYQIPGDTSESLLVESVQSLANHLEQTTWDLARQCPADAVSAVPYIRIVDATGNFLTSSRLEAHRLASAYALDSKLDGRSFREVLLERFALAKNRPLNIGAVYREVFALDPVTLLHGVFFAQGTWPWQPKISRAVSAFVEASNAAPAVSGGVKKDSVNNNLGDGRTSDGGYGMVPHHRTEFTASTITLSIVIDNQQIRAYGLSDNATELLFALADWEIATLLSSGLRLRTACDLALDDPDQAPDLVAANDRLAAAIRAAESDLGSTTELVWDGPSEKPKK